MGCLPCRAMTLFVFVTTCLSADAIELYHYPQQRNRIQQVPMAPHESGAYLSSSVFSSASDCLSKSPSFAWAAFVLVSVLITATLIRRRKKKNNNDKSRRPRIGLFSFLVSWWNRRKFVVLEDTGTHDESEDKISESLPSKPSSSVPIQLEKNSCTLDEYLQAPLHSMDSLVGSCLDPDDDITVPISNVHRAPMNKFGEHLCFMRRQILPTMADKEPPKKQDETPFKDVASFKGAVVEV